MRGFDSLGQHYVEQQNHRPGRTSPCSSSDDGTSAKMDEMLGYLFLVKPLQIVHTSFSGRGHRIDLGSTQLRWHAEATIERVPDLCTPQASSGLRRKSRYAHR